MQTILVVDDKASVRTLVRGELPSGRHEAVWQGRDEAGRPLGLLHIHDAFGSGTGAHDDGGGAGGDWGGGHVRWRGLVRVRSPAGCASKGTLRPRSGSGRGRTHDHVER